MLQRLRIREVLPGSARARIVRIGLGGRPFDFTAGQALMLGNHRHERPRAYSIAVPPAHARRNDVLEVLVGVDDEGRAGPHLTLEAGTLVDLDGPIGNLRLPEDAGFERVVFVAGGTGIAPLRAMLGEALASSRQIRLIYSARTPGDFAYVDELRELAEHGHVDLRLTVTRDLSATGWRGRRGRIRPTDLVVPDARSALYIVCGPLSMVCAVHDLLHALGVPPSRVLMEQWCRRQAVAALALTAAQSRAPSSMCGSPDRYGRRLDIHD